MSERRKRSGKPSIEAAFRNLSSGVKSALSAEESPLRIGLAALAITAERCQTEYLSLNEIVQALEYAGVTVRPAGLQNAFSRAGSRIAARKIDDVVKYKVMTRGMDEVGDLLGQGNVVVVHVQAGQPRTARKELAGILADLEGTVRVTDPYFGEHTLDALEAIPAASEIRFLTARVTGNEPKLRRLTQDLKTERPSLEIRVHTKPAEIHDRYIHSEKELVIVGHGLKDIGNRESFVIVIDQETAPDLIESVRAAFDVRWGRSTPF